MQAQEVVVWQLLLLIPESVYSNVIIVGGAGRWEKRRRLEGGGWRVRAKTGWAALRTGRGGGERFK